MARTKPFDPVKPRKHRGTRLPNPGRPLQVAADKTLEFLERRQMFSSITLEDGILVVRGRPDTGNELNVALDGERLVANNGRERVIVDAAQVKRIKIVGGERNDTVQVDPAIQIPVFVQTGDGRDTIFTAAGDDTVTGGNGNDFIDTGSGKDLVHGGNGRDRIFLGAGDDKAIGGNGSDRIHGGPGRDTLEAQSGDDHVYGEGGDDQLDAGVGFDTVDGGDGDDVVRGETIDDLSGGPDGGNDQISRVAPPPAPEPAPQPAPESTPQPAPVSRISFTLINADTNQPIKGFESINDNATIDLAKLPTRNLNVRANAPADKDETLASIAFSLNGRQVRVENIAPFALAGDKNGNFSAWTPKLGQNTIAARAYTGANGTGAGGQQVAIRVNVVDSKRVQAPNPTPQPQPTPNPTPQPAPGGWRPSGPVNGNQSVNAGAPAPSAVINAVSTRIPAGHAVHVHALKSTVRSGSSLSATFEWDFGDPGSAYNTLRGTNAAHVYDRPGEYTITLTVRDNAGRVDTATQHVVVAEPGRRVVYVSNDGNDNANGGSPDAPVRSWDRVRTLLDNNTEIRFRAGDTFAVNGQISFGGSNLVLRSYGNGDRPVLRWTGSRGQGRFLELGSRSRDVTVRDLTFDSRFSADTDQDGVPTGIRPAGTNFTALNNQVLNISYFINSELKPTGVLAQQNVAPSRTGLRAYLSYVVGNDHVYLGNTVANSTREHVIRADGAYRVLIAHNDFANVAQGRAGDRSDIMKQTITVHWGADFYVHANRTTGGRVEIGPLGNADGLRPSNLRQRLDRVVIDGNDFGFAQYQRLEIDHGTDGVVIRGNRIRTTDGAGINIQAMGRYTSWPQYGNRNVRNVWITSDNQIQGTRWATVGRGSENINIADPNRTVARAASTGEPGRGVFLTDDRLTGFDTGALAHPLDTYALRLKAA